MWKVGLIMADYIVTPTYTETTRQVEPTDKVINTFVNGYFQLLLNNDAYLESKSNNMINVVDDLTLELGQWENASAPYVYRLTVSGITASDNPIVSPRLSSSLTLAQAKAILKAFGRITRGTTSEGTIVFICDFKLPEVSIPITIKGR